MLTTWEICYIVVIGSHKMQRKYVWNGKVMVLWCQIELKEEYSYENSCEMKR